jgi:hypothetical protein
VSSTLNALTVGAVAGWSSYILYVVAVLARFNGDFSDWDVLLGLLIAVGMLMAALGLRIGLPSHLQNRFGASMQALLLAVACLFWASVLLPRS